ncbi:MAG: M67 family metallopeptidase [Synechococcaceae cyanobacterium SM2_3_1]|nr:M67 family metallopeptidase [Synechococcaceae cyanobacterium SM2_3_1]
MVLSLTQDHLDDIRKHGEAAFPYECCGLLLGQIQGEQKQVLELWQVENSWEEGENPFADGESRNRRFLIEPQAFKAAHDYAQQQGLGVIGTYHSHPNHPPVPSEFDRQHAFPWGFSCMIVSVQEGLSGDLISWVLDEQDHPQVEPIQLRSPERVASH